jgi:hypothetical protein
VRRWKEEAPASVDAERPPRTTASTAALDRIAAGASSTASAAHWAIRLDSFSLASEVRRHLAQCLSARQHSSKILPPS